jgi:hypothetical protein
VHRHQHGVGARDRGQGLLHRPRKRRVGGPREAGVLARHRAAIEVDVRRDGCRGNQAEKGELSHARGLASGVPVL